jgi:hypothetical protein
MQYLKGEVNMTDAKLPKVIKRHRLKQGNLSCTMVHLDGDSYQTIVSKEVEGLSRVVRESKFLATSHRHAIRKFKRWLNSHYPVTGVEAKAKLEEMFSWAGQQEKS